MDEDHVDQPARSKPGTHSSSDPGLPTEYTPIRDVFRSTGQYLTLAVVSGGFGVLASVYINIRKRFPRGLSGALMDAGIFFVIGALAGPYTTLMDSIERLKKVEKKERFPTVGWPIS